MQPASLPPDEFDRLAALQAAALLDTAAETEFDELVHLAAEICGTPIALVSLIDAHRQWFKSRVGLNASETPREQAFCAHAILGKDLFIVEDAARDERFSDNPLVTGDLHIRFYAGAPLHDPEGFKLGTLCVIDREPRKLDQHQEEALRILARQVSRIIALRIREKTISNAKRSAEERRRLFESFYSILREGIVYHGADGAIEYFNQSALEILGLTESQLLGRSSFHPEWKTIREDGQPFPPEEHPAVRSMRHQETCTGVIMGVHKPGGSVSWISINSVPLRDSEGRPNGACVSFFDITEQKRHESDLREARDAAETADRAKSEFLAVMSHEIRTPMNGVIGMASLLATTPLEGVQHRYVEVIQESGRRLIRVINDILDYSKMEAGKLDLIEEDFSPSALVRACVELMGPQIAEKGLEFRLAIDLSPAVQIRTDPDRLRQILLNLLSNAVKFTHSGTIALSVRLSETHLDVVVRDSGIGIERAKLALLFRPFSQGDATMSRQYGGSGLGLAICSRLVELMGGRIAVESEEGLGTAVSFSIPVPVIPAPEEDKPEEDHAIPRPGLRILVAEDDTVSQELISAMLRKLDARSTLAEDGRTAIELARAARYDAAIIDLHMPGVDGIHVMRTLRSLRPEMFIVAATAATSDKDRAACEEAGSNAFLKKPYDLAALSRALSGAG